MIAMPVTDDRAPNPALLDRLSTDQRTAFLKKWNHLPAHVRREIEFDLNGPGWTPAVIAEIGHALAEFPDVSSRPSIDFGPCSPSRFRFRRTALRLHDAHIIPR